MKNNSKKDTVKKITKKHIIIAIIIMGLIITTTFGAVILLQNNKSNENIQLEETNNNDNSENNETNENENSTPTDQEESQNSEKQEKPKKIIELYVEINKDSYEYTRVNELSLMGNFYDKYYYKNKVIISELPLEAKLLIIASNLNLNATDCGGEYGYSETICVLKQESFERAYSLLFNEKPKEDIKNINYEGDPYTIKYNDKVDGLIFTEAPYGFPGCHSYFKEVITSSKTNENQIEYITATMYFDLPKDENYSCTEYVDLYSDIEMTKLISPTIKQGTEKREGLKSINKLNQYKYIFKYSEEIERYYFYSVEKIN